mgnify:CR=1 FL=1
MQSLIDFLLHFDVLLPQFLADYGAWVYLIVFAIVFCETGLVVTPFLPGDSMLFALGAFAAMDALDFPTLWVLLTIAAVAGDSLNYTIGKKLGAGLLANPKQKIFKPEHYQKAHAFYEKHGGKAIVLSRFVPIVRTFAPFVAGVAKMNYLHFLMYNIAGGIFWVTLFLGLGFGLGEIPWVKGNFKLITIAIIVLSILPIVWEVAREKLRHQASKP